MTRAGMLTELREVLNDASTNSLFSEARLLAYLAEGQDKFCELTGFFVDRTNHTATLVAATESYALSDRVLEVLDVWDGARKLGKFVEADRVALTESWDAQFSPDATGVPRAWQTDRETGKLTIHPVPTAAEAGTVLTQRVHRASRSPLDRKTSTVTLAGTLHADDTIAATINGTVYSYTVLGTEGTLSAVATALAAVIDAAATLVATASGQVVTIAASDLAVSTTATVVVSGAGATVTATAADVYSAEPEIPARFHRAPVEWAAYKCFNHHDMETQDPVKATDHLRSFNLYAADGRTYFGRLHGKETRVGTNPAYRT